MKTVTSIIIFQMFSCIGVRAQDPQLTFYGNGNIQKSIDTSEKLPASTGVGVNWVWFDNNGKYFFNKLELDAAINIAATVDTLYAQYDANKLVTNSSSFGASILTPLNSGQAVKIGLRLNLKDEFKLKKVLIDGLKIKYVGSNRNWQFDNGGTVQTVLGTNNYLRIGIFQEFLPIEFLDDYSINFGLYYAHNSIQGDIGHKSKDEFRSPILGTKSKSYNGPEIALEIRLKNLRAEFAYSWLGTNNEVSGLTGGRLLTTISFVGGFGLKLD